MYHFRNERHPEYGFYPVDDSSLQPYDIFSPGISREVDYHKRL